MANTIPPPLGESPVYLIAAAYSGYRSGDRELESTARRRLLREYGIRLTFEKPSGRVHSANDTEGRENE